MRISDLPTPEQRREATEPGRLAARFKFAKNRVAKIADGEPPLSRSQLTELAGILIAAAGDGDE